MSAGPATEAPIRELPVTNPATGEVIATVPELGTEEVHRVVAVAREAQPTWAAIGFEGRAEVLMAARDWMAANAERVVTTIVGETGRPVDETQFAELSYGLASLEFWAQTAGTYLGSSSNRPSRRPASSPARRRGGPAATTRSGCSTGAAAPPSST